MIEGMKQYHVVKPNIDNGKISLELRAALEPCPFCGAVAVAEYAPGSYGITGIGVHCTGCGMKSHVALIGCGVLRNGHFEPVSEIEAFDKAVTSWNRRTTS